MEPIKIEHDVPLPMGGSGQGKGKWISLFRDMKAGDGFVCETSSRACLISCAKNAKVKITTAMLPDDKYKIRCWRVK